MSWTTIDSDNDFSGSANGKKTVTEFFSELAVNDFFNG